MICSHIPRLRYSKKEIEELAILYSNKQNIINEIQKFIENETEKYGTMQRSMRVVEPQPVNATHKCPQQKAAQMKKPIPATCQNVSDSSDKLKSVISMYINRLMQQKQTKEAEKQTNLLQNGKRKHQHQQNQMHHIFDELEQTKKIKNAQPVDDNKEIKNLVAELNQILPKDYLVNYGNRGGNSSDGIGSESSSDGKVHRNKVIKIEDQSLIELQSQHIAKFYRHVCTSSYTRAACVV